MLETLKTLCQIDGTSGHESAVRDFIIGEISSFCDYSVDALGNLIAKKKGKKEPKNKVCITAHMDEVALIITQINDDGTLLFDSVGGINDNAICGKKVRIHSKSGVVFGVIGVCPIHLVKKDEQTKFPKKDEMFIFIGANSKEEAEKLVYVGQIAYFDTKTRVLNDDTFLSKAVDDRFGCSVLIEMIKSELEFSCTFCFLVQEEVGARGAKTAMFDVNPDFAIVIEATAAGDIPPNEGAKKVCLLGNGAVCSSMDKRTIYDSEMVDFAFCVAKEKGIAIQSKTLVRGSNDAGSIQVSRDGVRVLSVSLPTRYIHSPLSLCKISDMKAVFDIVNETYLRFCVV